MSQFLASGAQSVGTSALAPVLQMNIQGWFPLGLTGRYSGYQNRYAFIFNEIVA